MNYFGTNIDNQIVEKIYQFANKVGIEDDQFKTGTKNEVNPILEKYGITKFSNEEVGLLNALTKVLNFGNPRIVYEVALLLSNTNMNIEPYLKRLERTGDYSLLIKIYANNDNLNKSKIAKIIKNLNNPVFSKELLCKITYRNCSPNLKIVEDKGTPMQLLYLAKFSKNQIDIEKIRNLILNSQDPESNYRMACYIMSRYLQKETGSIQESYTNHIYDYYKKLYKNDKTKLRALSKEHTNRVAEIKSERYCYKCAMNVKGVDRASLFEVVANGDSAKYMLKYAIDIPNANIDTLRESIHATKEDEYIEIFDKMFPTENFNNTPICN